ncbi:MAG: 4-hydroxy-tetrahydrodipicolinate reductase [Pseudomonadota bacterium]
MGTGADKIGVTVTGVAGRMGRMLAGLLVDHPDARLVGATVRPGHPWTGADLGNAMGGAKRGLVVHSEPSQAMAGADAVIDFTSPASSIAHAEIAAKAGIAHIIGTTGFSSAEHDQLKSASAGNVVVQAGNMSLGVNLLTAMTKTVAAALGAEFDIEIVEAHHRHKVDAPSGTALMLGAAAADGRAVALDHVADRGRNGMTGPRPPGAIGFSSVRGGDIVGEHDVIFAADGERIVLRHIASDRAIFARGALRAALWAQDMAPGTYDMKDVLNLK